MTRERFDNLLARLSTGELTAAEAAQLEEAMRANAEFRAEAEALDRLDQLLAAASRSTIQLDDDAMRARIRTSIESDIEFAISDPAEREHRSDVVEQLLAEDPRWQQTEREYARLDNLLGNFAERQPELSQQILHARIMQEVHREHATTQQISWHIKFTRYAGGLAVAAALVLAVQYSRTQFKTAPIGTDNGIAVIAPNQVTESIVQISYETPSRRGEVVVSFDQSESPEPAKLARQSVISGRHAQPRPRSIETESAVAMAVWY